MNPRFVLSLFTNYQYHILARVREYSGNASALLQTARSTLVNLSRSMSQTEHSTTSGLLTPVELQSYEPPCLDIPNVLSSLSAVGSHHVRSVFQKAIYYHPTQFNIEETHATLSDPNRFLGFKLSRLILTTQKYEYME